jgi:hypothetical protein
MIVCYLSETNFLVDFVLKNPHGWEWGGYSVWATLSGFGFVRLGD